MYPQLYRIVPTEFIQFLTIFTVLKIPEYYVGVFSSLWAMTTPVYIFIFMLLSWGHDTGEKT